MRVVSLLAGAAAVAATRNAAIDKVIEMLKDMENRGKSEKQEEKVAFSKFDTWAEATKEQKKSDIEDSRRAIANMVAKIEESQALQAEAEADIAEAVDTQSKQKADIDAMKKVRADEAEKFAVKRTELQDSIYGADKAIQSLSSVPEHVEAASFLQKVSVRGNDKHWHKVQALMQMVQATQDPFSSASQRQSGPIIDMLKTLKDDFEDELETVTSEESNHQHEFEMHVQGAKSDIADAKAMEGEKRTEKAEAKAAEGNARKNKNTETKSKADDEEYLKLLSAEHDQKTKDFEARQKSRSDELTAIGEAISIIQDVASSGIKAASLTQTSFLQVKSSKSKASGNDRIIEFLLQRGSKIGDDGSEGDNMLVQLATAAQADPFVKINRMIKELISKMEEEAAADMTKKGKCDKDIASNKMNLDDTTASVNKLSSKVDMLETEITELKATTKRLTKEVAETKDALATAKKDRSEEKAENEKTISETTAAVAAVDQAMTVLQNYYAKVSDLQLSATSIALLQENAKKPEFETGEYKGMGGGGVLGLMEVIKSDMDALLRETTASEEDAANAHADFVSESETAIASKSTLNQSSKETLAERESELLQRKDELDGADGARQALAGYEKEKTEVIDPICRAKGVSFEERQAKREEEIQSLGEALEIIEKMGS